MKQAVVLNVVLGHAQDSTGDTPVDVPALTIEGNEAGLRHLISGLEKLIETSTEGGYHTHLLHEDLPGISLEPRNLFMTFRRIS